MNLARMRAALSRIPYGLYGLLNLVAVTVLIAAPQLAAAEPPPQAPAAATGGQQPVLADAGVKPHVEGRVSDRNSLGGDGVRVRGLVTYGGAGRALVTLQVRLAGTRHWRAAAASRVASASKFTLVWHGSHPGRYLARLVVRKNGKRAHDGLGSVYVFRRGFASWYGPGLYGHRTACGGRLTPTVLGVAHKTLPCGTRVTFHLNGRTVTARVIDRGPFAAGRDWDLTPALKRRLHFGSTGTVNTTR